MDPDDLGSIDVVELVIALEEAFPDLKIPNDAKRDDIIRLIQDRLGGD